MTDDPAVLWEIPKLPFLYTPLDTPHNPRGIPDFLPFRLGVDQVTGRALQRPTEALSAVLRRAYSLGSMVTGTMAATGIGRNYADDFVEVLAAVTGRSRLDGLRVLEIGCGSGYLLHRLDLLGADVRGIEPGPQAELGRERYGVRIERGFFPDVDVGDGFDVVVLYMLLEHVEQPEGLLGALTAVVRPGGRVVVAVQDEEPYLRAGDVSMLFHEHYSYFTRRSLMRTIEAAGGREVDIVNSRYSHLLMAHYTPSHTPNATPAAVLNDLALARGFRRRAEAFVRAVSAKLDRGRGGTMGFFVPARAVNLLAVNRGPFRDIRFFDDNPLLHAKYYPGFDARVESRGALIADPPSIVLVMSLSFGAKIVRSLTPNLPGGVEVVDVATLLAPSERSGDTASADTSAPHPC